MKTRASWSVAAVLVGTLVVAHAASPVVPAEAPDLNAIPWTLGAWSGQAAPPLDPEVARVLAADRYVHRFYRAPGSTIEMDVAYYAQPRVGANMHSPLNCLPGTGWTMSEPRMVRLDAPGQSWNVRSVQVARGSSRFAMTYWFQSRQRLVGDEIAARMHLLEDALHRRPSDAGLVRLIAPATASPDADRDALTAFATQLIPEISTRLRP